MLQWENETRRAAEYLGWTVVDTGGESDWQGTGYHLLRKGDRWATMSWNWGTCPVCDGYMDAPLGTDAQCAEAFVEGIHEHNSEQEAATVFRECTEVRD